MYSIKPALRLFFQSTVVLTILMALGIIATYGYSPAVDAAADAAVNAASGPQANFKWVYHYDAAQNEGELTVTVLDAACQVPVGTHVYPSVCKVQKDHVSCDVDIQAAANNAYAQEGFGPQANAAESYPFIFAEVTGRMSYKPSINGTIIDHPSLVYNLQSPAGANSARFLTNWSGTPASSDFFGYNKNATYTMRTSFGKGQFYHDVNNAAINTHGTTASMLPFRLDNTTFKIYEPNGFELHSFTIDPPKCGFG